MVTKTASVSVRISEDVSEQVNELAKTLDRPRSWVVEQALVAYLEHETWFAGEVHQGLIEAGAGDFAEADAVKAVRGKWGA